MSRQAYMELRRRIEDAVLKYEAGMIESGAWRARRATYYVGVTHVVWADGKAEAKPALPTMHVECYPT